MLLLLLLGMSAAEGSPERNTVKPGFHTIVHGLLVVIRATCALRVVPSIFGRLTVCPSGCIVLFRQNHGPTL